MVDFSSIPELYVTLQSLKREGVVLLNFDLSCVACVCCLVFRHAHYRNRGEELNMADLKTHARCCLLNNSTI